MSDIPESAPNLDPQVRALLRTIEQAGYPEVWELSPSAARVANDKALEAFCGKGRAVHDSIDRSVRVAGGAEIRLRILVPRAADGPLPVLVWLHGGGHVIGSVEGYDTVCRELALSGDCVVVSVDYRLAPEHKFPTAVTDCYAALGWVAANAASFGADADRIALGGDSAGGNLAAVCAMLARDAAAPRVIFQLLVYPATASHPNSDSHHRYGEGLVLTRKAIHWFNNHYLRNDRDRSDPRYAPLAAGDLAGLPETLMILAQCDPLRDEGVAYADRLRAANVPVTLVEYPGMVHAFFTMPKVLDAGRSAIARAGAGLAEAFKNQSPGRRRVFLTNHAG